MNNFENNNIWMIKDEACLNNFLSKIKESESKRVDYVQENSQPINSTNKENSNIIQIKGELIPYKDYFLENYFGCVSCERILESIKYNIENGIKTILDFDCPGGYITGVQELAEYIYENRDMIESYISGLCCSGGLWVASATSKITAIETAKIGSVGVLVSYVDYSEYLKKEGIKEIVIVSSKSKNKYKDPKTDEGKKKVMESLDKVCDIFHNSLAKYKDVDVSMIAEDWGEGDVFFAEQALVIGMIDNISTFNNYIKNEVNGMAKSTEEKICQDSYDKGFAKANLEAETKMTETNVKIQELETENKSLNEKISELELKIDTDKKESLKEAISAKKEEFKIAGHVMEGEKKSIAVANFEATYENEEFQNSIKDLDFKGLLKNVNVESRKASVNVGSELLNKEEKSEFKEEKIDYM